MQKSNRKDTTIFKFSLKSTIRFIDFYSTNFKILFSKIIFFIYFLTWTNFLLDPKMKIIFILRSNSPHVPRNLLYRSFKIPIPSYSRYNDHLSSFPSSNVVHNNDSRRQVFFEFSLSKPVPIFWFCSCIYIYIYPALRNNRHFRFLSDSRESVIRNPLVIPQASSASNECARQSTLFKKRWNRIRPLVKISKHHFFKHGGGELRQFQPFPSPNEPLELTIRLLAATHHFSHPPINFSRIQIYE